MTYTKNTWASGGPPALNGVNLNNIETGLEHALESMIYGCALSYTGPYAIAVQPGGLWITGTKKFIVAPTTVFKAGFTINASILYYVYGFAHASTGNLDFELAASDSTTATEPVVYKGTAMHKPGDLTRRYLGAIKGMPSGGCHPFASYPGNFIRYMGNTQVSPFSVLTDGRATTETTVACAAAVPPASRMAYMSFYDKTTIALGLGSDDDGTTLADGQAPATFAPGAAKTFTIMQPLGVNRDFTYRYNTAPAVNDGLRASVLGYVENR